MTEYERELARISAEHSRIPIRLKSPASADRTDPVERELEAIRAEQELADALEPFAKALADWGDEPEHPNGWTAWEHPIAMNVTLGDFRRAAKVWNTRHG